MSVSGRVALADVRSGREALPDGWEVLADVRSGREALPDVWEWSRDPLGCPGGWETRPDVREWSLDPPRCLGVVGSPSQLSGRGREALVEIQEGPGGPR